LICGSSLTDKYDWAAQPRVAQIVILTNQSLSLANYRKATRLFSCRPPEHIMSERKLVTITADGACLGNGQAQTRAAAAAILNYQGRRRAVAEYIGESTNQRAEIIAVTRGLESLKEPCTVIVRSDSRIAEIGEVTELILTEAVQRLENVITPALRNAVSEGLQYLANDCDGARTRDGVGFSKFDADFGHRLATKTVLNPRELAAGRRLLRRYAGQLASYNPALVAIL